MASESFTTFLRFFSQLSCIGMTRLETLYVDVELIHDETCIIPGHDQLQSLVFGWHSLGRFFFFILFLHQFMEAVIDDKDNRSYHHCLGSYWKL